MTTPELPTHTPDQRSFVGLWLPPAAVATIGLGSAYVVYGITIVEKSLSALVLPVGLMWLALLLWFYLSIRLKQRSAAILSALCLVLISGFGNCLVANQLAKSLEYPYFGFEIDALEKLDAVVVLGGGTTTNLNGQPQLANSGDRIAMAAKVIFAGKTDRLVCTGLQTYRSTPEDLQGGEEAQAILRSFGIAEQSIETIGGENTAQEMQALKKWMANHPDLKRIGILTSAWHLSRAMRLANNAGIQATPIPADFLSRFPSASADWVIPSSENLQGSSLVLREYCARVVGR